MYAGASEALLQVFNKSTIASLLAPLGRCFVFTSLPPEACHVLLAYIGVANAHQPLLPAFFVNEASAFGECVLALHAYLSYVEVRSTTYSQLALLQKSVASRENKCLQVAVSAFLHEWTLTAEGIRGRDRLDRGCDNDEPSGLAGCSRARLNLSSFGMP